MPLMPYPTFQGDPEETTMGTTTYWHSDNEEENEDYEWAYEATEAPQIQPLTREELEAMEGALRLHMSVEPEIAEGLLSEDMYTRYVHAYTQAFEEAAEEASLAERDNQSVNLDKRSRLEEIASRYPAVDINY